MKLKQLHIPSILAFTFLSGAALAEAAPTSSGGSILGCASVISPTDSPADAYRIRVSIIRASQFNSGLWAKISESAGLFGFQRGSAAVAVDEVASTQGSGVPGQGSRLFVADNSSLSLKVTSNPSSAISNGAAPYSVSGFYTDSSTGEIHRFNAGVECRVGL